MLNIVYKEVRGMHRAAYVLAIFSLGSQVLAMLRDRLLAHEFGAGTTLDVYYAAFRLPDLLFVLFASTLSVYVLIPFVTRAQSEGGDEKARSLLSQVFTLFLLAYAVIASLIFIFAPQLLPWMFPGIKEQGELLLVTRVLLLQPVFLGISSLFGVVTQLHHRFVLYAVSPLIYNIGIIVGILFLYPWLGLPGLALGVVLGAIGHAAIQWPLVESSSLCIFPTLAFDIRAMRDVLVLSLPRALTLSLGQIVLLILVGMASRMTEGSVSVFQFAYNLQSVPLSIIGVSYSVAAFPMLAELYSKNHMKQFGVHISTALRHITFWSVPAIVLMIVMRAQVVRVILGSGAFDWADTRLTAAVLALLSLSLLAQAANLVVVRAFYAGGYTKIPFLVTLGGSILAVAAAYGFHLVYQMHPEIHTAIANFMRLDNVVGSEVLSLAFGYTLTMILQTMVFLWFLGRQFAFSLGFLWRAFWQSLVAAGVGGILAYFSLNFFVVGIDQNTFIGIFIQGLLSGVAGVAGIIMTYAFLKNEELHEVVTSFQRRLLKTSAIAPEVEVI